ncbi:MAG TPA: hypothetical protein VJZ27_16930, partial [Aggregatilineales bacterium]|nr:hypothetical protein [Aggregatilineales bacterium]
IREWLEFMETVGLYGEVKREWALRLDGDDWVERMKTPPVYVDAIRALLNEADSDLRTTLTITGEDDSAGWGFDLPAVMIKGTKL